MKTKSRLYLSVAAVAVAAFMSAPSALRAQQAASPAIHVGANDLGGVVTGPTGPEAGVWVIAETTDLGTKMSKMVVTDDQGRYVLPDLPKANYNVWVRGYGLVDSAKVQTAPGKTLNLTAVKAPSAAAAAQYYPAIYWFAMMKIPDKSQFPGTGPNGNGISPAMKDQGEYLDMVRTDGCVTCHQLGNKATREIEPQLGHVQDRLRGLDAPRPIRPGRHQHDQQSRSHGHQRRPEDVRRLDRPDRGGRTAGLAAAAAAGHRAQRRRDGVGLGEPLGLPA